MSSNLPRESHTRCRLLLLLSTSLFFVLVGFVIYTGYARVRIEEEKGQSRNKLNLIGSALKEYLAKNKNLPPGTVYDKDGNALYSWRVLLLPYLGEEALYRQFKLDEPWNSPHNFQLLPKIPKVYQPPGAEMTKIPYSTFYQVFDGYREKWTNNQPEQLMKLLNISEVGILYYAERRTAFVSEKRFGLHPFSPKGTNDTVFEAGPNGPAWGDESLPFSRLPFHFGFSGFISVVEAGEAVPWSKPADLPYHPEEPLPKLGGPFVRGFHALYLDGEVRFISIPIEDEGKVRSQIANIGSYGEGDW